jgi:hypothetical protein
MEAMDRVEEEQRAHPLVKVIAGAAEGIERVAFSQKLRQRRPPTEGVE